MRAAQRLKAAGLGTLVLPALVGVDPTHGAGLAVWGLAVLAGFGFALMGDTLDPRPRYRPTRSHYHKLPRR